MGRRKFRYSAFGLLLLAFWILGSGCSPAGSSVHDDPALTETPAPQPETAQPSDETGRPEKPIVLGFSQLGSESDWRLANTKSIQEAAQEAGVTLLLENAEQSQEKQFQAIRSFIRQKVDVIAVAPVIQSGWEPILKEAKQAGIPVILSDRAVDVTDTSLYVTFIGSDFYEEGVKAGKYLLDKMRDAPGRIRIVELAGTVGSSPSIDRGKGFRDTIRSRADFAIVRSAPADFTLEKGKAVMKEFLQKEPEPPQVLFAHNDDMALGAIEAIEEAGLRPGKDIVIISIDGTRSAFEKMTEGKINAVIECNPLLGPMIMQAAGEIMQGHTLPKRIVPPESVFTEEMAAKEVNNRKY
ncbi:ABC transporter substrate-binding protein [Cohnella caldifontis]|uniref:ABC transporter substrate-binding protein n=1 Tax=Cohnella caldifontis TaxID=3027471 RepID=UPI0023EC43AE|nr:ABC transporter substrate-binding protein [Cohnella sp. YIM B05605]